MNLCVHAKPECAVKNTSSVKHGKGFDYSDFIGANVCVCECSDFVIND